MVEQSAKFKDFQIPLIEPVRGLESVSAVIGIPEWWPTGQRIGIVLAHGSDSDIHHPMLEHLQRRLTEEKFLTLRFNFPFAEAHEPASADTGETLLRSLRTAIATLGRDPTSAPAHIFVGGHGLGARVAAQLATTQTRIEGAFLLSYPLHAVGSPESISAEQLYRITSPTLFIQGTRDHQCDLGALEQTVRKMGTPTEVRAVDDADENFRVPGESLRSPDDVYDEIFDRILAWTDKHQSQI